MEKCSSATHTDHHGVILSSVEHRSIQNGRTSSIWKRGKRTTNDHILQTANSTDDDLKISQQMKHVVFYHFVCYPVVCYLLSVTLLSVAQQQIEQTTDCKVRTRWAWERF